MLLVGISTRFLPTANLGIGRVYQDHLTTRKTGAVALGFFTLFHVQFHNIRVIKVKTQFHGLLLAIAGSNQANRPGEDHWRIVEASRQLIGSFSNKTAAAVPIIIVPNKRFWRKILNIHVGKCCGVSPDPHWTKQISLDGANRTSTVV